jgi:hypothetical protein
MGLDNLTSIGGNLQIGVENGGNLALTSLTGLDNLTSIGGDLGINSNSALTSLTALDRIDAGTITGLLVSNNISLFTCQVQSICDYLANPNGTIEIYGNSTGCNSVEEVETACGEFGLNENGIPDNRISIFPNPSSTQITISTPTTVEKNTFMTIYNINGQQILKQEIRKPNTTIDISKLISGVYIVRLTSERTVQVGKFIRE